MGAAGPRVFETYKSLWEIFHDDGSAPNPDFNSAEAAAHNACRADAGFGGVVLASRNGIDDIGQAGIGELLGPLVAQNGRYVRYQTLYNQVEFDEIVRNKFYLRSNLPVVPSPRPNVPVFQFANGSIAIKAAWLDMAGFSRARRKRFYTRSAMVKDPATGKCSSVTVGLVGLHIVQKTPSRPQWIWSSFEQVDTAPNFQGAVGTFTLNDGTPGPMPAENPLALMPLARQPAAPFNVIRSAQAPIHFDTSVTNRGYQELLQEHGLAVLQAGGDAVAAAAGKSGAAGARHADRRDLPYLSGNGSRDVGQVGVRQSHDGDVRSGPSGAGLHELPQPGATGRGFHVECAGPRVSVDPGAGGAARLRRSADCVYRMMGAVARQKLFLIDSFGFIFRAYHARARSGAPPMRTSTGFSTEAVYIFNNMLRKLSKQYSPTYIAAVFESSAPTHRVQEFAEYKANRTEMPPDLFDQIPFVRRVLEAMRIPILEYPGFEADDVIGTLARRAEAAGLDVVIVSSDKDMLQLVNERVSMLNPAKDDEWYDPEKVKTFLGVRPDQVADLFALKGDAVDNIPGAPGIGDKGARDLIERFGSLNAALERAAEVEKKTYRESLQNNVERIRMSQRLATISTRCAGGVLRGLGEGAGSRPGTAEGHL